MAWPAFSSVAYIYSLCRICRGFGSVRRIARIAHGARLPRQEPRRIRYLIGSSWVKMRESPNRSGQFPPPVPLIGGKTRGGSVDKPEKPPYPASAREILLRQDPPSCCQHCSNPQILGVKRKGRKYSRLSSKKPLRSPAVIRKYRLTEADNTATADGNGGNARKSKTKNGDMQADASSNSDASG